LSKIVEEILNMERYLENKCVVVNLLLAYKNSVLTDDLRLLATQYKHFTENAKTGS
jgi:hypothetical protein